MSVGMGIRLLETLTSALYEDPIVLFREYVQNSVDAFIVNDIGTTSEVNIDIDQQNKVITIIDNGYGIEPNSFKTKMTEIGKSNKSNVIDQIGFRGIGRLSAMPFCKKLIFTNKSPSNDKIQTFSWDGTKYNSLLEQNAEDDLEKAIEQITHFEEMKYTGKTEDHFFKVELQSFSAEIFELINSSDFEERLKKLLPLKYSNDFLAKDEIHNHYETFMGNSLAHYEFIIKLNGKQLFKPYTNDNILESDIVFWDLSFKQINDKVPDEKIGVLWFTFNRKVSANPIGSPRGIYVRSKNMLMGNENSFADAITKGNSEYVATYRELTQTLNGVYGELLIDTSRLSDNARRDWFKIDTNSNELKKIITDYLRKLKNYRYAASQAFNDKTTAKKNKLIEAYNELTGGFNKDLFEKSIELDHNELEERVFQFAEDDIPRYSITSKKFYELIINALKEYFTEKDAIDEFFRVRTYIKNYLDKNNR